MAVAAKPEGPKPKSAAAPIDPVVAGAVAAALPLSLSPQLATLTVAAPKGDDWLYEVKFDGYRIVARIDGTAVRLLTRNGNDWTAKLQGIANELAGMGLPPCWLDGEIVVLNKDGVSDFGALQNAFDAGGAEIQYFVFDLPFCNGCDLRATALRDRRALLERLLDRASGKVRFSQTLQTDAAQILRYACQQHLEGVIGKRLDSAYVSRRSPDWIKLKCTLRQEFVIGGYTEPQGSRTGLGALLLGIYDDGGGLHYVGSVGTGFDSKTLAALQRQLAAIGIDKTPFIDKPRSVKGIWVEPKTVAEVSFAEWTRDGKIRHAVFHGLRADKPAGAIRREKAMPPPKKERATKATKRRADAALTTSATAASRIESATPALPPSVRITNPQRVIDPSTQQTKRDLVDYYLHAARRLLPHLARRPVALVRAPAGIAGQHFFQKHAGSLKIEDIRELPAALDPGHPSLLEIDSFAALISAAQMNVVEFHTWNATSRNIDKPDRMTFDLDPGADVPWSMMINAAMSTKTLLEELGLRAFLKTSGGKGLHIVVPLAPREGWDEVKDFSRAVVERLARQAPTQLVAKSGAKNRVGKIFVDYLRNGRGATTAAAFSARARPGLGVSIPCHWDELDGLTGGDHWTIATAHDRLETAEEPWADYAALRQTLTAPRQRLHQDIREPSRRRSAA